MSQWLFRAWDTKEKIMINDFLNYAGWEGQKGNNSWNSKRYIIQQWSGLKDNYKKDIYTGDILRFQYNEGIFWQKPRLATGVVVFEEACFILKHKSFHSTSRNGWTFHDIKNKEIIGNIFTLPKWRITLNDE